MTNRHFVHYSKLITAIQRRARNSHLRRSCRKRYTHYVIGQLVQIALTLYDVIVDVSVVDEQQEEDGCHVTFRLDFVNWKSGSVSAEGDRCVQSSSASGLQLPTVNGVTFFTVMKRLLINLKQSNLMQLKLAKRRSYCSVVSTH